jgi:hypothetical protein
LAAGLSQASINAEFAALLFPFTPVSPRVFYTTRQSTRTQGAINKAHNLYSFNVFSSRKDDTLPVGKQGASLGKNMQKQVKRAIGRNVS